MKAVCCYAKEPTHVTFFFDILYIFSCARDISLQLLIKRIFEQEISSNKKKPPQTYLSFATAAAQSKANDRVAVASRQTARGAKPPPAVDATAAGACLRNFSGCAFVNLNVPAPRKLSHGSQRYLELSGFPSLHCHFATDIYSLLTPVQGNALHSHSTRVVNTKDRNVPPYAGKEEWMAKFAALKKAIPEHCFEHSYVTSFRYLFVDIAVSAALFYAVSFLEQMSLHPAVSALLYFPSSHQLHLPPVSCQTLVPRTHCLLQLYLVLGVPGLHSHRTLGARSRVRPRWVQP